MKVKIVCVCVFTAEKQLHSFMWHHLVLMFDIFDLFWFESF